MSWDSEVVYHEGDQFYAALLGEVAGATATVELESYIFSRDALGHDVLACLQAAVARGVEVRLLLDGVGCADWSERDLEPLLATGLKVRFYHPLPWQTEAFKNRHFPFFTRLRLELGRLNRRNHRKVCIIDGKIAFLGGMNISAWHSAALTGPAAWRDTSVRVSGAAISCLRFAFESAWSNDSGHSSRAIAPMQSDPPQCLPVALNGTPGQRRAAIQELVARIAAARGRVWVATPYFVPTPSLLQALRASAKSGADVRLLLPRRNDIWWMRWAGRAFYFVLLKAGVRIFEYLPRVLHAKIVLADDWLRVGSSNLNSRSLLRDLEVDAILSRPESLAGVRAQFSADFGLSEELRLAPWRARAWPGRVLEKIVLLLRRWI